MSRPPSARPKTSAGARAGSARPRTSIAQALTPSDPPPSAAASGPIARPASRTALSRAGVAPPRSSMSSRSGFVAAPVSRFSASVALEMAERPGTGMRPPTGFSPAATPAAVRPITQQGLRAPTRAGTATGQRMILDKNYFIGQLRAKANQLNAEIVRLEKECERGDKAKIESDMLEKRASDAALAIKKLNGMLLDYNVILDRMQTSSELSSLEMEANEWKRKADEVAATLEELFTERKEKEDTMAQIQEEITAQKKANNQAIASMDPSLKDRYEALKEQSEALKELVAEREAELGDLQNLKNQLETDLLNSPLKQKAANLRERLVELAGKERELMEERANEESLDQKKAKLIESVRKNNEEIAAMEKQIEQINEQIESSQEELHEFNADVESGNREQIERYRGLQVKEAEMSEFFATFDEQRRLFTMEMEEFQDAIVKNLKRISANLDKVNITMQVNDMDPSVLELSDEATPEDLKQLHVRLEEELINMEEMEARINMELEAFDRKGEEMREELARLADYDKLVGATQEENEALSRRRESLLAVLPQSEAVLTDTEAELDEINEELRGDDRITVAENLQKKLEYLQETNAALKAQVEAARTEGDFEQIKAKVLEMQAEYNRMLIAAGPQRR